jgi:hypothetical protein
MSCVAKELPAIVIINPSFADFGYSPSPSYMSDSDLHYRPLIAIGFAEGIGEPLQTLVQTVTSGGASGLDELEPSLVNP